MTTSSPGQNRQIFTPGELGTVISELRALRRKTQFEVASALSIDRSQLAHLEGGRSGRYLAHLLNILEHLGAELQIHWPSDSIEGVFSPDRLPLANSLVKIASQTATFAQTTNAGAASPAQTFAPTGTPPATPATSTETLDERPTTPATPDERPMTPETPATPTTSTATLDERPTTPATRDETPATPDERPTTPATRDERPMTPATPDELTTSPEQVQQSAATEPQSRWRVAALIATDLAGTQQHSNPTDLLTMPQYSDRVDVPERPEEPAPSTVESIRELGAPSESGSAQLTKITNQAMNLMAASQQLTVAPVRQTPTEP